MAKAQEVKDEAVEEGHTLLRKNDETGSKTLYPSQT